LPYGKRPTNASVRFGSKAHAKINAANTKSGTAIQTKAPATAARTATASAIPIEIVSLLLAIAVALFLHSRSASFTRAQEVGTGISLTLRQSLAQPGSRVSEVLFPGV
jgi:hypothetical protein